MHPHRYMQGQWGQALNRGHYLWPPI